MEVNQQGLLRFNAAGKDFIFSGNTGLLLETNAELDQVFKQPASEVGAELAEYLYGGDNAPQCLEQVPPEKIPLQNLTLFVTDTCNLSCSYCYVNKNGAMAGTKMTFDTFRSAVDTFTSRFSLERRVNVLLFGGEPLLNLPLLREAVAHLKEISAKTGAQFSYSVVTNGTIVSEDIIDFLLENDVNVLVSVDATKEAHDELRPFLSGKGSYDTVKRNVARLAEFCNVGARVTICDPDTDLVATYKDLRDLGFWDVHATLVSEDEDNGIDLQSSLGKLRQRLREMEAFYLESMKNKEVVRFGHIGKYLKRIHLGIGTGQAKILPCSAGYSSFTIATNGDVYLCHRFNNVPSLKFGSVTEGVEWDKRAEFLENHQLGARENGACGTCWASAFCGGTCYHTSYAVDGQTQSVNALHCAYTRETLLTALRIYVSMDEEERQILDRLGQSVDES